jgi:phosphopantothenoylcysteine decarboxylase/phosphopantothenate--cysteine ligase
MHEAVMARAATADVVVMAAAVADYAPDTAAPQKVAKGEAPLTLVLKRTPDILKSLGERRAIDGGPAVLVGFAAETEDVEARAAAKLRGKRADLIVANDVSRTDAGFDVDSNEVILVTAVGNERVPLQAKSAVASAILDRIETLLRDRPSLTKAAR